MSDSEDEDVSTRHEGEETHGDICRVCRLGPAPNRPLFHPCMCIGSIGYVHQDCLIQWLKHSGKEYCELCHYRFQFAAIYRHDMPQWLPLNDLYQSLIKNTLRRLSRWLHLGFVVFMWLFIVPVCSYRIYRFLFYGSLWKIFRFPLDMLSLDNLFLDSILGLVIVTVSLLGFISLVWLKDQLTGPACPNWLVQVKQAAQREKNENQQNQANQNRQQMVEAGRRARERQNEPERVNLAKEVHDLQKQIEVSLGAMEGMAVYKLDRAMTELRMKEMKLTYDLEMPMRRYLGLVKQAKLKHADAIELWRKKITDQVLISLKKDPAKGGMPRQATWAINDTDLPTLKEFGLSPEEILAIELFDRPPMPPPTKQMRRIMMDQLEEVRMEQRERVLQHNTYQEKITRCLTYHGEDDPPGLTELRYDEQVLIRRLRIKQRRMEYCVKKEADIIYQQSQAERAHRREEERVGNRWYNRFFNRPQNINVRLGLRQRRPNRRQPAQPNIGQALVGLAREPPDPNAEAAQADQLTKILGLDGSFRFLEHVLWLVVLISTLIVLFVYIPCQIGSVTAEVLFIWHLFGIKNWKGVLATFVGYLVIFVLTVISYCITQYAKKPTFSSMLGIGYLTLKISLLMTVEAGIFPLLCGWWMDVCSFAILGSTLGDRQESLNNAPGTVMFLHWLAGMIFIFYFASFVVLLREVFRPGVLWFLRNLNDQNFHPIQDMITQPFQRHMRRFIMSNIMFGVSIMVLLLIPTKIISYILPTFLPYNLTLMSSVSPIREVQLELILLQFIIPTLLEHSNSRAGIKSFVRKWSNYAADNFDLHSYLLDRPQTGGVVVDMHGNQLRYIPYDPTFTGPVFSGQSQVMGPGFAPFKPYLRPSYFYLKIAGFMAYTIITSVSISLFFLLVPILLGRGVMAIIGIYNPPDIYTAAIGLYLLWFLSRAGFSIMQHLSQGALAFVEQMKHWVIQALKCVVAGVLLFVVIPLLLGHLVDLLIISPLRVPIDRTPVFYPSTEWALGLLHTKCTCGMIWLTNIGFKRVLDQVYQAGVRNLNLTFVIQKVAWPVTLILSFTIAIPYVFFVGFLYESGLCSYAVSYQLYRYFFPSVLLVILSFALLVFVLKQLVALYTHVRNERYLIGRQLVNYGVTPVATRKAYSTPVQETGMDG